MGLSVGAGRGLGMWFSYPLRFRLRHGLAVGRGLGVTLIVIQTWFCHLEGLQKTTGGDDWSSSAEWALCNSVQ